jgi:hypothetical protein
VKRAAVWLAALMLLAACQTTGPVERALSPTDPRIGAGLEQLAASAASRHAMRGMARLSLDAPDLRFRRPQRLVVERPTRLRVEVLGLFGQVAAILATEDGRYQFFDPSHGSLEEGEVSAELLWQFARVDLTPEEAAGVLLGAPQPSDGLLPVGAFELAAGGVAVLLGSDTHGSPRERFEFDGLGRLQAAKRFDDHGSTIWSARFDDYRELGDQAFAFQVALSFPRVGAEAEIQFKQVELNPDLPADVFVLSVRPGVR